MDYTENIHQSTAQKFIGVLILSYQGRQYTQLRVLNSTCYEQYANMSYKKYTVSAVLSQLDRKINFCLLTGNQAIKPLIWEAKASLLYAKTLRQIQHRIQAENKNKQQLLFGWRIPTQRTLIYKYKLCNVRHAYLELLLSAGHYMILMSS